jgi:hypothetical protein
LILRANSDNGRGKRTLGESCYGAFVNLSEECLLVQIQKDVLLKAEGTPNSKRKTGETHPKSISQMRVDITFFAPPRSPSKFKPCKLSEQLWSIMARWHSTSRGENAITSCSHQHGTHSIQHFVLDFKKQPISTIIWINFATANVHFSNWSLASLNLRLMLLIMLNNPFGQYQ